MLKMLEGGMASTDDWKVLKRRHTWDLVASLFRGSKNAAVALPQVVSFIVDRGAGWRHPKQGVGGIASDIRKHHRGRHLRVESRYRRPMVFDQMLMLVLS